MTRVLAACAAALLALSAPTRASDLGVEGHVFPIVETDIMAFIKGRLEAAKASGKIDALARAFAARSRRTIERPPAVRAIVATREPKSWLFDPSIVVPRDLADPNGRVFAHAGDRVNPLLQMPDYDRVFLFIDGDDARQVQTGLDTLHKYGPVRAKVVLVSGAPLELMRRHHAPFYFDQAGVMTTRFGVTHVPAEVVREGDKLRVTERLP